MRYSVYVIGFIIASLLISRYGLSDQLVTTITVVHDNRLHADTQAAIQHWIDRLYFNESWQTAILLIKKKFDCINTLTVTRKSRTHSALKYTCYTPACCINRKTVITREGIPAQSHWYLPACIEKLPRITTPALSSQDCRAIGSWAAAIPLFLHQAVWYVWEDPTRIELFFPDHPHQPLVITNTTALSLPLINTAKKILSDENNVALDARFTNMMVIQHDQVVTKKNKNKRRRV